MSNALPYTMTRESISLVHEGKPHVVKIGAPNFIPLRAALIAERWDEATKHLTSAKSVTAWARDQFVVNERTETITFGDLELPKNITARIFRMAVENQDPTPLFLFWEKLQKNPSYRSVNQLWSFMQNEGIPLSTVGDIVAYKSVRQDYKDHHSGKFDNHPGTVNQMPRNQISDDPKLACHDGFHVGAFSYAQTFMSNGRIVIVKVDPADVVCVPYDESQRKMRVCKYEVVGHHNGADILKGTIVTLPQQEPDEDNGDDEDGVEGRNEPPAKVVDLMNKEADEGVRPVESKRRSKKGFTKLDKLDAAELLEQSIDTLRRYASKGLLIVGATKIPGGKAALVQRILEVRE